MSFRKNDTHQMTLTDSFFGLTEREQKALEKSWAKVFADDVFPMIDEERFECLYSDKASRPNTPVNVIVGALIIKELFNLSDDEVFENLLLDPRFQYALRTTSFEEQPMSDKTLTRFRQRCYDYERLNNVDLYHDCVTDLAAKTAKLMKIDGRIRRMDSLMVESNIRKLSRMELLYRCISKLVKYLHDNGLDELIQSLERYYDPNDFNKTIYHSRSTEADDRIEVFRRKWASKCQERGIRDAWLSIDGSNNNCQAVKVELSEKGKAKSLKNVNVVGYMYAIDSSTGCPVTFAAYRGGRVDCKELLEIVGWLKAFDISAKGVIVDRGFATAEGFRLLDENGLSYVAMLKGESAAHKSMFLEHAEEIRMKYGAMLDKFTPGEARDTKLIPDGKSLLYGVSSGKKIRIFSTHSYGAYVSLIYDSANGRERKEGAYAGMRGHSFRPRLRCAAGKRTHEERRT